MWLILNESGTRAIEFTSMLEFSITDASDVVDEPIENGSFATYNRADSPLDISVTLGIQGDSDDLDDVLSSIRDLKNSTELVSLQTPEAFYDSLNITRLSYTRSNTTGPLVVELDLVEIRQVNTDVTTTNYTRPQVKNPTSTSTSDTGKSQGRTPVSTRRQDQIDKASALREGSL